MFCIRGRAASLLEPDRASGPCLIPEMLELHMSTALEFAAPEDCWQLDPTAVLYDDGFGLSVLVGDESGVSPEPRGVDVASLAGAALRSPVTLEVTRHRRRLAPC
ncbi:hypothetical protein BJH93_15480 [Kocuria polaris]|nr:hypothetical protein [Kocuria polaris]